MKGKKIISILLTSLVITTMCFTGCNKKTDPNNNNQQGNSQSKEKDSKDKDQYLNYVFISDAKTIDPSLNDDTYGGMIITDTMECLTRVEVNEKGESTIKPAAAESWSISDDKLVYTFKIRKDMTWEDGKPLTAKNFEYSLLRTLKKETGSSYVSFLYDIKNGQKYNNGECKVEEVGVKATDDYTLVITLEKPAAYFMQMSYFALLAPQREDIVTKYGEKYGSEGDKYISCGPFKVSEWVRDSKIVLVKNDKYYDKDSVNLEKVSINIIKEEDARMQEFYTGNLDIVEATVKEWRDKFKALGTNLDERVEPTASYMMFNQTADINGVKLFSNAKIRKAFSLAVDRKEAVDLIAEGTAVEATGWIPYKVDLDGKEYRTLANFEPITQMHKENADPKALFIEGLKELKVDPDPSKITVEYLVGNVSAKGKKNAEIYQQQFQNALGIKVNISQVESAVRSKRIAALDYQFTQQAWLGDYNDPNTFLQMWNTKLPNYPTGWNNAKFDELLEKANKSFDTNERLNLFKEAEKLLVYDDAVIAPIFFYKKSEYTQKYVKNVMIPTFGTICELKYAYTEGRK